MPTYPPNATFTPRLQLPRPGLDDPADGPDAFNDLTDVLDPLVATLTDLTVKTGFTQGIASARPAAGTAGRFYYATDTGALSYDSGSAWLPVAPIPLIVTSLPTAPVDGQECYLQSSYNTTNSGIGKTVVWHLRYRAASSYSSKWEFIGGAPMIDWLMFDDLSAQGGSLSTVHSVVASIAYPPKGDYLCRYGATERMHPAVTSSHLVLSKTNVQIANSRIAWQVDAGPMWQEREIELNGVMGTDLVETRSWIDAGSTFAGIWSRSLSLTPIRLG